MTKSSKKRVKLVTVYTQPSDNRMEVQLHGGWKNAPERSERIVRLVAEAVIQGISGDEGLAEFRLLNSDTRVRIQ